MDGTNVPEPSYVDQGLGSLEFAKSRIAYELGSASQMLSKEELGVMKEKLAVIQQLETDLKAKQVEQQAQQTQPEERSHTM